MKIFDFATLQSVDLIVDATYKGGNKGNTGDDPISKLLGTGNQGGFRHRGSIIPSDLNLVVLMSSLEDPEWPDSLDVERGQFIYYGDNKRPGHDLHDTEKKGNIILRDIFSFLHQGQRDKIPPIFIFTKGAKGRDVIFKGLAVPGENVKTAEDLVAIWKAVPEGRFQNYKAVFTILDEPVIKRKWIDSIKNDRNSLESAPGNWIKWIKKGKTVPLIAKKSRQFMTKAEQLPSSPQNKAIVETILDRFKDDPYEFEKCAMEIARLMDQNIIEYELTRRWVDGGRDAIGKYRIGNPDNGM
jgi:hypothetical protein